MAFTSIAGVFAQDGSISPYSYFGIGDMRSTGTVENQMMGGVAVFADSIHINLKNPAAYSRLGIQQGEDFGITTYTAGISHKEMRLKTYDDQQTSRITNLDYLSLGFSLGKGLGMGFGLLPYSSSGYNMVDDRTINGNVVTTQYTGSGGLNRVYLSVGWEFVKDFSAGITTYFNFGKLKSTRMQGVENVQYGTLDRRESRINGWDFNYALNYTPEIRPGKRLYVSARANQQANLVSENTQEIGSFSRITGNDIDVVDVNLDAQGLHHTFLKIPTTATFGLGYGQERKWFMGAEYSFQGMSTFENEFIAVDNVTYTDASTYAFGGFYLPDYNSFTSYFDRIVYRAGVRLEDSGMIINDKPIRNFGITFGLGLPLGRDLSNINIGFELGRRGTTMNGVVEESYFKANIGLSLNDLWFRKRKIN